MVDARYRQLALAQGVGLSEVSGVRTLGRCFHDEGDSIQSGIVHEHSEEAGAKLTPPNVLMAVSAEQVSWELGRLR